jgi:flagellar basal-body rod modification protein FlgD
MPIISPISSASSAALDTLDPTVSRTPQKTLGQDDFLKLLAKQFQVQDPLKPMEDTAFIAQMAQFSALEQSKALTRDMTLLRGEQERVAANAHLGRLVTVEDVSGQIARGDVTAVELSKSGPRLIVDGRSYPLSAVLRVEPGLVSASAPPPATTGGAQS